MGFVKVPDGGPKVTFDVHASLRERIFSFSRESILKLKARTNNQKLKGYSNGEINAVEIMGKAIHDPIKMVNEKMTAIIENWLRNAVLKAETRCKNQRRRRFGGNQRLGILGFDRRIVFN